MPEPRTDAESLRKREERSQLLSRTLEQLLGAKDPDSIVRDLCPKVAAHVGADVFFNYMVNEKGDRLRLHAYAGIPDEVAKSIGDLDFNQAICGTVAATRQSMVVNDIQCSVSEIAALARECGLQSYAGYPLCVGDRLLGTLSFATRHRPEFEQDEIQFLRTVSQYVALSIDRLRAEAASRENEERFRTLADNIAQLAWISHRLGWASWYNKRWYDYTGTTFEEMQGRGWEKVHHPDHLERVKRKVEECFQAGVPWEDTFPLRGKDGQWRWFLSRAIPIRDETGAILHWFGTNTDVTELRETQEALALAKSELERVNQDLEKRVEQRTTKLREALGELEAFSYSIAHDMRAPLRSMQGFSQILLQEQASRLDDVGQDYLQRISKASERMDCLIQDVLHYSKVVRADVLLTKVQTREAIRGILDSYPMFAPDQAEIRLQGEFPPVLANESLLTQCLSNLLGNAVKFVAPGVAPAITIRAEKREVSALESASLEDDGVPVQGWVRIFIEDNGIGIAPEQHQRIFAIFQRLDKGYEGTGIGLAIVQKAVSRMGGQVGLRSELGKGSCFWLDLPSA